MCYRLLYPLLGWKNKDLYMFMSYRIWLCILQWMMWWFMEMVSSFLKTAACYKRRRTYSQQKKREYLFIFNWFKIKYVKFKKYILHVKLTVYYTVSFIYNIYFLNSTYFIFNQFKSTKFSRFFCCWVYYFWPEDMGFIKIKMTKMNLFSLFCFQFQHVAP